ncbi:site-2 protease family protein [Candidatus Uhrbacteria bacterium]|nr:site-2 protease family protein [Candidatus Uhrbacteria bacterium]
MIKLLFEQPMVFAVWLLAFLLSLSVHEFAHALIGNYLGDQTAKRLGRLTLNPAAHVDPLGLLTVTLIGFGWGKPVPYNPYNLRWQKWGPVAIAFAGPTSNLILAVMSAIAFGIFAPHLGLSNLLTIFLMVFAQINIALCAFNLVPLPPLDGSKLLLAFLSAPKYHDIRNFIETKGSMILLILIIMDSFANLGLFSVFMNFTSRIVLGIADGVTSLM